MAKFRVSNKPFVSAVFCLSASNAVGQHMQRGVIKALAPPYLELMVQARWEGTVSFEVREWRFEPNETSTTEEIVFRFRFVPRDSPPKDQGTAFIFPATVEVRHLQPRRIISASGSKSGDRP